MADNLTEKLQPLDQIKINELKEALKDVILNNYSGFIGFLNRLPSPYQDMNKVDIYKEFQQAERFDSRIGGALEKRKSLVLGQGWEVSPSDDTPKAQELADFIVYAFGEGNFRNFLNEALNCIYYGFQVIELIWTDDNGEWIPKAYKSLKPQLFSFDEDGNEYVDIPIQHDNGTLIYGIPIKESKPFKFLRFTHQERFSDPQGVAVAGT